MAYGFLLASALKLDVEKRYQLIEVVFAQADIVDGTYMQVSCPYNSIISCCLTRDSWCPLDAD